MKNSSSEMQDQEYLSSKGAWVAQLVKCPTLDFGSGHDLRVKRLNLVLGSLLSLEPA